MLQVFVIFFWCVFIALQKSQTCKLFEKLSGFSMTTFSFATDSIPCVLTCASLSCHRLSDDAKANSVASCYPSY